MNKQELLIIGVITAVVVSVWYMKKKNDQAQVEA